MIGSSISSLLSMGTASTGTKLNTKYIILNYNRHNDKLISPSNSKEEKLLNSIDDRLVSSAKQWSVLTSVGSPHSVVERQGKDSQSNYYNILNDAAKRSEIQLATGSFFLISSTIKKARYQDLWIKIPYIILSPLIFLKRWKHKFWLSDGIYLCKANIMVNPYSESQQTRQSSRSNLEAALGNSERISQTPSSDIIDRLSMSTPDSSDISIPTALSKDLPQLSDLEQANKSSRFCLFESTLNFLIITFKLTQLICISIPFTFAIFILGVTNFLRSILERSFSSLFSHGDSRTNFQITILRKLEDTFDEATWRYFYWAIATAGPCYIKFVQWAATRSDLFPPSWCFRFAKFHWNVPPHPYPYTAKVLEEVFGKDWKSKVWLDPKTVGSGSIAQVYRGVMVVDSKQFDQDRIKSSSGKLKQDNHETNDEGEEMRFREVAIKIVHPHTAKAIKIDLDIMQLFASLIELIPRAEYFAPGDSITQFKELVLPQLDMRTEAMSFERFQTNLSKPWSRKHMRRLGTRVVVPRVFKNYTSETILVESFEEGLLLGQWMRLTSKMDKGFTPEKIALDNDDAEWISKGFFLKYLEESSNMDMSKHRTFNPLSSNPTVWNELWIRLPYLYETGIQVLHDQISNLKQATHDIIARFYYYIGIPHYDLKLDPTESPNYGMKQYWEKVGRAGTALFLQMVFIDNFVHADLHPGNLMIRFQEIDKTDSRGKWEKRLDFFKEWIDGMVTGKAIRRKRKNNDPTILTHEQLQRRLKKRYSSNDKQDHPVSLLKQAFIGEFNDVDFELVLLDCGLTTSLSAREYRNFTDVMKCLCVGDGYTIGELFVQRARKQACSDVTRFCQDVHEIVQVYHEGSHGSAKLGDAKMGELLARMLMLACYHRVELDPRFAALFVAIAVLEGVGRQLDPNMDVLRAALPYARQAIRDATFGRA